MRYGLAVAGLYGASGVAFAALGAHGLPAETPARLGRAFATGADFHLLHAIALLALAPPRPALVVSYWLLLVGSAIFSGALYALALSGLSILGAVAPAGGITMMIGWLTVAYAGLRSP